MKSSFSVGNREAAYKQYGHNAQINGARTHQFGPNKITLALQGFAHLYILYRCDRRFTSLLEEF